MKEKFFCVDTYEECRKRINVTLGIIFLVYTFAITFVLVGGAEVWTAYNVKDYQPLHNAVQKIVHDGEIDLLERPEGTECTVKTYDRETIIRIYYQNYENSINRKIILVEKPYVIVRLYNDRSGDYVISSTSSSYVTEKDFLIHNLVIMVSVSIISAVLIGGGLLYGIGVSILNSILDVIFHKINK